MVLGLGLAKKVLPRWQRKYLVGHDAVVGAVGRARALIPAIRRVVPGERPASNRQAVYVHFDRWGTVHDFVVQAVRQLAENGYAVTFVSNAPKLPDDQIALLLPHVREVVHRRNVGYDFAAYRDGIARLPERDAIERLILQNDSVYGPIYPLTQLLNAAENRGVDAFGVTDSWEQHYHLQSYFLMFFPAAIRSGAFRKFWRTFPTGTGKGWMIRNGEVKLSSVLARDKLTLGALCPYWDVSRKLLETLQTSDIDGDPTMPPEQKKFLKFVKGKIIAGKAVNPSHYYWDALIRDWRCPFLKRELIQSNPVGVPRPWSWEALLRERSTYDTNLVLSHLKSL